MKTGIHPAYVTTEVHCGCGNTFTTRSTETSGSIHVEVCSNCHPFYTGKQKILDTGGPSERLSRKEEQAMKTGIHPAYVTTEVHCGCGNTFTTRSTETSGSIHVEVCSNCHPFYTGKQKILDTGGRVARFEARYGKRSR
jgi:large subunit ribosomal protein L31